MYNNYYNTGLCRFQVLFLKKTQKRGDSDGLLSTKEDKIRRLMQYQYCFFDLDGTVIDSSPGILRSFNYALDRLALPRFTEADTASFIGPPLIHVFCKRFGLSEEDGARGVAYYRECYRAGGMLECRVYDGIRELLDALSKRGVRCVLATCKPHEFATKILHHHGLLDRFSLVAGPEMDGTRGEKDEVISYAKEQLGIRDSRRVLMIGDRANDVWGARQNKMECLGVLWGFGTAEELEGEGAMALCSTPADVLNFFDN